MELCLKILGADMGTKAVSRGVDEANLVYSQEYEPDDRIILKLQGKPDLSGYSLMMRLAGHWCMLREMWPAWCRLGKSG